MPDWVKHAIWWQVYPLGFTSAGERLANERAPVTHRLSQLTSWLDYAVNLGASGIALGPVFAAQTHGYDTTDHYRIDPRLGDERDFAALVQAAHARGLRLLLDGVFNHVGRDFPAFRRVLEQGPSAPEASWFRLTWPPGWTPGTEPEYGTFEGHEALVALNHDEPAVADYVAGVMNHWLDAGADGWRLDAAYAVPAPFWAEVVPRVRARHPRAYLVGEVIHGDYPEFVAASGLDSVTQYELWKAIWSALNDHNLFELGHALGRHNGFLETFAPLTFVGNHDVTRLASRLDDDRHFAHALAVLLTVGGTPAIYYGDEQAFRGIKEERAGGDDEIRPGVPGRPGRPGPRRLAHLPAAPGPHRAAPPPPVAAPGPDHDAAPDRGADDLPGHRARRTGRGGRRPEPAGGAQPGGPGGPRGGPGCPRGAGRPGHADRGRRPGRAGHPAAARLGDPGLTGSQAACVTGLRRAPITCPPC